MKGKMVQKQGFQPAQARRVLDARSTICPEAPRRDWGGSHAEDDSGSLRPDGGELHGSGQDAACPDTRDVRSSGWEQPVRADPGRAK